MSDIQQWRRKIALSRPRTPLVSSFSSVDEDLSDRSERNSTASAHLAASEPIHTKRHSRPKFLTRASQYFGASGPSKQHGLDRDQLHSFLQPEPPKDISFTKIDMIIASVFEMITTNLGKPLPAQSSEPILRVLEAYRTLQFDKALVVEKLAESINHNNKILDTLVDERNIWKEDEKKYLAEIKRLEVMIAHGKTGLSEVALARQQSLIRRGIPKKRFTASEFGDPRRPVYDLLDKRRDRSEFVELERFNSQRLSPSHKMSALSRSLKEKASYSSSELPAGTPPERSSHRVLANVQLPPEWSKTDDVGSWAASLPSSKSNPATGAFDDFSSTGGDLLEDEIDQKVLTAQAVEHVATLIAAATGQSVRSVVEELLHSIVIGGSETGTSSSISPMFPTTTKPSEQVLPSRSSRQSQDLPIRHSLTKRRKVNVARIDTAEEGTSGRPFSFLAGDDSPMELEEDGSMSPPGEVCEPSSQHHILRGRSPSMIPSPVLEHVLARPRRERDDSSSSLVTSFQRSPCGSIKTLRTPSGASSHMSAVTTVRKESGGRGLVKSLTNSRNNLRNVESD